MQMLTHTQTQEATGGVLWTTPAMVAILDSSALGPLAFAFGTGYAIGTYVYNNFISE